MDALYGVMAEFETPDAVLAATQRAYAQGYRKMDAYTPFPIEGLDVYANYTLMKVDEVVSPVNLFDGPGVADRVAVALVELGVAHRP